MWITSEAPMKGQAATGGRPANASIGRPIADPSRWMRAVSSALSVLDLTRAFQPACKRAPNSTAAATPHVSVTRGLRAVGPRLERDRLAWATPMIGGRPVHHAPGVAGGRRIKRPRV